MPRFFVKNEQVKEEILSTRNSYENCIAELKDRLTQLEGCGESCCDEKDIAELNQLKEEGEDELARVENDYKERFEAIQEVLVDENGDRIPNTIFNVKNVLDSVDWSKHND
mgnify:CR=1 FL=1